MLPRRSLTTALFATLLVPMTQAGDCDADAGAVATLSTLSHGVSGTVTILDDHTLLVEDFHFDGGGLSVYFYLGVDATPFAFQNGVLLGSQLVGTVFTGESLLLEIPAGVALEDYGAISVWCAAAGVSFGHGSFVPPAQPTLTLAAQPEAVSASETLLFSSCGGEPTGALGLVVTGVNGASAFTPIVLASFSAEGGWSLPVVVPAGVMGLEIEFEAFGFVSPVAIGASGKRTVTFL